MTLSEPHVLRLLRCLHTGSSLRWADAQLLAHLNQAIVDGTLTDLEGTVLDQRLEKVLVNEDRSFAYVVVNNIYRLVAGQAIPLGRGERTRGIN